MPQQYYIDVTEQELHALREALPILERIQVGALSDRLEVYLYGVTKSPAILDAAKEAIAKTYYDAPEEIDESDVELTEIALAVPLSSDTLYYLTGSGLKLRKGEFAYKVQEGGGVKDGNLLYADFKPQVSIHDFSHIGISNSDQHANEFLSKHSTAPGAQIKKNIRRTEEATQPGAPAPAPPKPKAQPAQAAPAPAAPAAPQPKQTSVHGAVKLRDLLEDFLG
jgi:hypothetical protein